MGSSGGLRFSLHWSAFLSEKFLQSIDDGGLLLVGVAAVGAADEIALFGKEAAGASLHLA
jgi:hypothetical protein